MAEWCQKPAVVALYSVPCWGFPLLLTIVLARLYLLGYAETVDLGNTCYNILYVLWYAISMIFYAFCIDRLVLCFFLL